MSVYKEIKTGLEQAIAYEKQNITDKEIKKAYEDCQAPDSDCMECPLRFEGCHRLILDYINRLEAENERLCVEIDELIIAKDLLFDEAEALIKQAKAEARKEFAERLKLQSYMVSDESQTGIVIRYSVITTNQIDNTLKEMENNNGNN